MRAMGLDATARTIAYCWSVSRCRWISARCGLRMPVTSVRCDRWELGRVRVTAESRQPTTWALAAKGGLHREMNSCLPETR